jgi:hypothetical protein
MRCSGVALGALFVTFFAVSFRKKLSFSRQFGMFLVFG